MITIFKKTIKYWTPNAFNFYSNSLYCVCQSYKISKGYVGFYIIFPVFYTHPCSLLYLSIITFLYLKNKIFTTKITNENLKTIINLT